MNAPACLATNPWLANSVRIERVTAETPGVATYDLVFADEARGAEYSFRPGQFNMLYLPGVGEVAISISGDSADRSKVPHTIREAGNVTRELARLGEGACIGLRGPFGSSWPVERCVGKDVVVVAGGIGLAPLRSAVLELLANRNEFGTLSLLYGARMPHDQLYGHEYEDWRTCGFDVQTAVDRGLIGYNGHVGVVTQLLDRLALPRPSQTMLLTCGPEVMMWYTVQTALRRGLSSDSLFVSLERNMNCAVGLCGHCQLGPEFLCKDGPVFPYDRVASILKVNDL